MKKILYKNGIALKSKNRRLSIYRDNKFHIEVKEMTHPFTLLDLGTQNKFGCSIRNQYIKLTPESFILLIHGIREMQLFIYLTTIENWLITKNTEYKTYEYTSDNSIIYQTGINGRRIYLELYLDNSGNE